jgi:chromosome segregation ATPase
MKNQTLNMIQKVVIAIAINALAATLAWGQSSSPEVFERVDKNIENAKANREDNTRNLKVVNANLTQVQSARGTVQADASQLKTELAVNQRTQDEIEKSVEAFRKSEDLEKKAITNEERKIAELEKSIQTLRDSIHKRRDNLTQITSEREKVTSAHGEWKTRGEQLMKLAAEAKVRDDRLAIEEKEWRGKKTKYEKAGEKWTQALAQQEKTKKNLVSLKGK